MKKTRFVLVMSFFCGVISSQAQLPALNKNEIKQGWILLFDGKTFEGWQKSNGNPFTGKG